MTIIKRNTWQIEKDNILGHKKESSLVKWLTDDLFATSGLDNTLKVFSFAKRQLVAFAELSKSTKNALKQLGK